MLNHIVSQRVFRPAYAFCTRQPGACHLHARLAQQPFRIIHSARRRDIAIGSSCRWSQTLCAMPFGGLQSCVHAHAWSHQYMHIEHRAAYTQIASPFLRT